MDNTGPRFATVAEFCAWLEQEARRVKLAREAMHGGTLNRYDLIHWADALQWAAHKGRERGGVETDPTDADQ